jgi:hypothetical protein
MIDIMHQSPNCMARCDRFYARLANGNHCLYAIIRGLIMGNVSKSGMKELPLQTILCQRTSFNRSG